MSRPCTVQFDWEVKRDPKPTFGERGWSAMFGVHEDTYMPHVMMLKVRQSRSTRASQSQTHSKICPM